MTLVSALPASRVLAVAGGVILLAWCARALVPPLPADVRHEPRALRDDYEHTIYLKRGAWAPTGLRPYLDVFSEYPPLATWTFALPYLVVGTGGASLGRID